MSEMWTKEKLINYLDAHVWSTCDLPSESGTLRVIIPYYGVQASAVTTTYFFVEYNGTLIKILRSINDMVNFLNTLDYWIELESHKARYFKKLDECYEESTATELKRWVDSH